MGALITDHQAKYFAHLLTRKIPSNDKEKIISTILDAQVEPKPHQIDAALFAFRSLSQVELFLLMKSARKNN